MKILQDIASLSLRCALSAGFLSAVAGRLGLWGRHSSGWNKFLDYTAQVNSFAPHSLIPLLAITSTVLELTLGVMLLIGFKTNYAALGAAILTFLFALAMTLSYGIKEPLDYSVFVFSAGAFLLATIPYYKLSIDQLLIK
ncbi:DoxX family protein [Chitinophaga filiformis]|uniref:DoxX protein n=1 Tax=Chitinophaga filiformis TaxID=104663 RepID=A0A1G7RWR2_CHIFI|nr:DoxX family protein [Chitinophaga filiformis]SDG15198.1 DoxX protein [Chitinophaga filiformis]